MALLKLKSITCVEQAETTADELYVTFNGVKRSLPNMTRGQTKTLGDEFLFEGMRELSLFENDGDHWYDRDDFIAKHPIPASPADHTLEFRSSSGNAIGAHYRLVASVDPPIQKAVLRLSSIHCVQQAETFTDELYVTFNGTKRSLPNMTQGQTEDLSDEFLFEGVQELTLFENDGDHWYDRDDFIAKVPITPAPANFTPDFKASGGPGAPGHYTLTLIVTPV